MHCGGENKELVCLKLGCFKIHLLNCRMYMTVEIRTPDSRIFQPAAFLLTFQSYAQFSLLPLEAKAAILR